MNAFLRTIEVTTMPRRSPSLLRVRAGIAPAVALALALLAIAPVAGIADVAAKEGFEARLDAPLSIDSTSGSTLQVGWTVFQVVDGHEVPLSGLPVVLRVHSGGNAETVSAHGLEQPAGSGHFVATLVVPSGGIGILEMGIPNTVCEDGTCTSWDMPIHLTGDLLVAGTPPGAVVGVLPAAATTSSTDATTSPVTTTAPVPIGWTPVVLALLLVGAVSAAWAVRRRRRSAGVAAG